MKNVVVVNGEDYWPTFLPGFELHHKRLQNTRWLFRDEVLWASDSAGATKVDGVLWRVGAIRPHSNHRAVLETIRFAEVPCVNSARTLLRGYDRLSMMCELREIGLPILSTSVAIGERAFEMFQPQFPAVVKVGNWHGGWGKAQAQTSEMWNDIADLVHTVDDYATVEPFVDYVQDVRCLAVDEQTWAMSRRGAGWKVNRGTTDYELIPVPPALEEYTRRAQKHIGADVLALDCLQTRSGEWFVLEYNDIPGFSGFPEEVRWAVARCLRSKL